MEAAKKDYDTLKIYVTHKVPKQHVHDAIDNISTQYSPWIYPFSVKEGAFAFNMKYDREEDAEGTFGGTIGVNMFRIQHGLGLMALGHPERLHNIIKGEQDAIDADILMQYVVFGKVIYG